MVFCRSSLFSPILHLVCSYLYYFSLLSVQSVSSDGAASCSSASIQPPLKRFQRLAFDISSVNGSPDAAPFFFSRSGTCKLCCSHYWLCWHWPDGLEFWQQKVASCPLLSPLAADIVSALASQAYEYVERVFSVCGDLTAGKRNMLTKTLEMRFFGKDNMKYYSWTVYWLCLSVDSFVANNSDNDTTFALVVVLLCFFRSQDN